jgi:hypothetical protein
MKFFQVGYLTSLSVSRAKEGKGEESENKFDMKTKSPFFYIVSVSDDADLKEANKLTLTPRLFD